MRATLGACLVAGALLTANGAAAASAVATQPTTGHPDLSVTVSGTAFGASEAVDVYLDTVDMSLLVTNASGAFSGKLQIPASAGPGDHTVTAVGRRSGDAAQSTFTVTTPWLQHGYGGAHLGFNPYENTISSATAPQLGVLWSRKLQSTGGTPIISGGILYHGTATGVQAVNAATGAVLWGNAKTEQFYSSPALANGVLYAASYSGTVYAMNAATGAPTWKVKLSDAFYSSPTVVNGVVYVASNAGVLYALNAANGRQIWSYTAGQFDTTPAVANGMVYIGSRNNTMYALDAATGAVVWSYTVGGEIESTAAVANNTVIFGADDNKVYALDAAGGSFAWSYTTGDPVYGAPAVANGLVYVGSSDGTLSALTLQNGSLRWSDTLGGLVRGPVVAGGVVYVSSDSGYTSVVDATYGYLLTTIRPGRSYFGTPAVSDGVLYVDSQFSRTTALALKAGTNAMPAHRRAPDPSTLVPDQALVAAAPTPDD